MGSIPTLTPSLRRESRQGAGCIPREYLQQYFLIGSTPIPSTNLTAEGCMGSFDWFHPIIRVWFESNAAAKFKSSLYANSIRAPVAIKAHPIETSIEVGRKGAWQLYAGMNSP